VHRSYPMEGVDGCGPEFGVNHVLQKGEIQVFPGDEPQGLDLTGQDVIFGLAVHAESLLKNGVTFLIEKGFEWQAALHTEGIVRVGVP